MSRLQIDMLPVGDSDAFLIEVELDGEPEVILIDGGRSWEDGERILRHLNAYYGGRIDHLVLSHIDASHAAGLLYLVESLPPDKLGQAWVQDMRQHGVDVERAVKLGRDLTEQAQSTPVKTMAAHLAEAVETTQQLIAALDAKGVPVREPFSDGEARVGPLTVLGPTRGFFEEATQFYGDVRMLSAMVEHAVSLRRKHTSLVRPSDPDESLEQAIDDPETVKQASVLLLLEYEGDRYLFTGDAGRRGLEACRDTESMRRVHLLKVPNHGSKHNLSPELLDLFSPSLAYISASGIGINPHPDLIAALQNRGAVVYTTAHSGNVWHRRGDVPPRTGYETRLPM